MTRHDPEIEELREKGSMSTESAPSRIEKSLTGQQAEPPPASGFCTDCPATRPLGVRGRPGFAVTG